MEKTEINDLPESIKDIAEIIGLEAAMKLVDFCGGQTIYIPKKESCELSARRRYIYGAWQKGETYLSLARQFNYTESHVRQIVREERERIMERAQTNFNFS